MINKMEIYWFDILYTFVNEIYSIKWMKKITIKFWHAISKENHSFLLNEFSNKQFSQEIFPEFN